MAECSICGAYKPNDTDICAEAWPELPKSKDVIARTLGAYAMALAFRIDLERWERHHLVICASSVGTSLTMNHLMAQTAIEEAQQGLRDLIEQQKSEIQSLKAPRRGFFAGLRRLIHMEA